MAKIKNDYTTVAADGTVLVHMAPKKKMKLSLTKSICLYGNENPDLGLISTLFQTAK